MMSGNMGNENKPTEKSCAPPIHAFNPKPAHSMTVQSILKVKGIWGRSMFEMESPSLVGHHKSEWPGGHSGENGALELKPNE